MASAALVKFFLVVVVTVGGSIATELPDGYCSDGQCQLDEVSLLQERTKLHKGAGKGMDVNDTHKTDGAGVPTKSAETKFGNESARIPKQAAQPKFGNESAGVPTKAAEPKLMARAILHNFRSFGSADCPCIGPDDLRGHIYGVIDGQNLTLPADYGAHCSAWDKHLTPTCQSVPYDCTDNCPPMEDWCIKKWCYVDPCNCKLSNLEALPKPSGYLEGAEYQGHSLYYSYATCGAVDTYSSHDTEAHRQERIDKSCKKTVDDSLWGSKDCRCTGIDPEEGTLEVEKDGQALYFDANYGANCKDWDDTNDPACKTSSPPEYCKEKWCYVNPGECKESVPPKASSLLPDATSDGKPLHWSYETCGSTDKFTKSPAPSPASTYGKPDCPCIGIDESEGVLFGNIGGTGIPFPADLGAHCSAWDLKSSPECPGADWCKEKWCYVDPCNCKDVPEPPKPSGYLAAAEYQGHSIYFSYATCGSPDTYSASGDSASGRQSKIDASCSKKIDAALWGKPDCECQGFTPETGVVNVIVGGKVLEYESDYGANCQDWDATNDPACMEGDAPGYCTEKWCYVANACKEDAKVSKLMPDATTDGEPIKYSYATCGGIDKYADVVSQVDYGQSSCPCIGIDEVTGTLFGSVDGKNIWYPADLGARCSAWDEKSTPGCPGADWCKEKWCYVDPCNCKGVPELPKPSGYLADAEYQGHSIYFSYATCGSPDTYSSSDDSASDRQSKIDASCSKKADADLWGKPDCECQGFTPEEGSVKVKSDGKTVSYNADYGANCQDWDASNDPACKGDKPPDYCNEKWCYVADDCKEDAKVSKLMPDATADGKPVKYSYATCGGTDKYSNAGVSVDYGESLCPCIGMDNVPGNLKGDVDGKKVWFPADYGAHCNSWDKGFNPDCPGKDWCEQKWCYVDPCNCKKVEALPKPSSYLEGAEYQGHTLYYSYATCGAKDSYSTDDSEKNRQARIDKSCDKTIDDSLWGGKDCRCTGIAPVEGDVAVTVDGKNLNYEAEYGANCQPWDETNDPRCKGDKAPAYCSEKWCYVNPNACKESTPPKVSTLFPWAKSDAGQPLEWSYATCGGTDHFSGYSAGSTAANQDKSEAISTQLPAGILVLAAMLFIHQ